MTSITPTLDYGGLYLGCKWLRVAGFVKTCILILGQLAMVGLYLQWQPVSKIYGNFYCTSLVYILFIYYGVVHEAQTKYCL